MGIECLSIIRFLSLSGAHYALAKREIEVMGAKASRSRSNAYRKIFGRVLKLSYLGPKICLKGVVPNLGR